MCSAVGEVGDGAGRALTLVQCLSLSESQLSHLYNGDGRCPTQSDVLSTLPGMEELCL